MNGICCSNEIGIGICSQERTCRGILFNLSRASSEARLRRDEVEEDVMSDGCLEMCMSIFSMS